jgi:hypothetical protein
MNIIRKKKIPIVLFAATLVLVGLVGFHGLRISPSKTTDPNQRLERLLEEIHHGLQPELAKLLFITERYRHSDLMVIFDGSPRNMQSVVPWARAYIRRNYRGQLAESWVKNYLHHSPRSGHIITLRFPDGRERPLRDFLLDELRRFAVR